MKNVDFILPVPNKETNIHHFSRLKCLKLYNLSIDAPKDRSESSLKEKFLSPLDLFKNEKRISLAFPELCHLSMGSEKDFRNREGYLFQRKLINIRSSFLESLHLQGEALNSYHDHGKEGPSFDSLIALFCDDISAFERPRSDLSPLLMCDSFHIRKPINIFCWIPGMYSAKSNPLAQQLFFR